MTARHEAHPVRASRIPTLAECRKALVAVVGAAVQIGALGVLHGTAQHVTQAVAAIGTVVLTYLVPNADPPPVA